MIVGLIFVILVFSFILIKAADLVIISIRRLSREARASVFAVSAVILALGTSLPEFFVGLTSALEGTPNLAFGVVLGSNIANIALIGGLSAFIVGKVFIHGEYLKKDVWVSLFATSVPLFLALDGSISRVDALILLMLYLAYATGFFRRRFQEIGREQAEEGFIFRFVREFKNLKSIKTKEFGRLFLGLALLLFSSDMIVRLSVELANQANIPLFLVGLVLLAVGTSLPELVFSIRSLENHQPSMFFGNILGSNIANSTFIIGVTTLISPLGLVDFKDYIVGIATFFLIFISFYLFIKSKNRLDRWESAVLLFLYFLFVLLEFV